MNPSNELKSAIATAASATASSGEAEKLRQNSREVRELLSQQLADLESAVSAAEAAHAEAVASAELNERGPDPATTAAVLLDARKAMETGAPDLRDKLRVADLVMDRMDARCRVHAIEVEHAQLQLREAQIAVLEQRAEEIRATAAEMFSGLRDCASQAVALSSVLSSLGARWPGPSLIIDRTADPEQEAITRHHAVMLAEIAAA